jgi:Flp pilus assembly protein TadD
VNIYLRLNTYYDKYGTVDDKRRLAQRIEENCGHQALGMMNAGTIYMGINDLADGGRALEAAYQLDSANAMVSLNYGQYLVMNGRFHEAIAPLLRVEDKKGPNFWVHYLLLVSYNSVGDLEEAERRLRHARAMATAPSQRKMLQELPPPGSPPTPPR